MNKEQTIKILSTLKAAFPSAYRGMGKADLEAMVGLWERMFSNDSYESVSKAVDSLICTREATWTPAIGEVKAEMSKAVVADVPTEEEAWSAVRKACRNGLYGSEKEFAKLHPAVRRVVGGAWQIKEWANFSDAEMDRAGHSFRKAYRESKDDVIRDSKLPESVREEIVRFSDNFRL